MRTIERFLFLLIVLLAIGAGTRSAAEGQPEEGFTRIFNGKDLSGWDGDPRFWSVKEGVIRGQTTPETPAPHNTFLIWRAGTLTDFELRLSFRIPSGNSGVQVRSKDKGDWRVAGYQAEVVPSRTEMGLFYDEGGRGRLAEVGQKVVIDPKGARQVAGSVGDLEDIRRAYKEKDWNDLVVVARGTHLIQKINGVVFSELTDDHDQGRALSGVLAVQIHTGPPMLVEFKDIRLKTLDDGAIPLFNGKDLTGWRTAETGDFAAHGKIYVDGGRIVLEQGQPMTGIAWAGDFPKSNYEVGLDAVRVDGYDFFCGMTFPAAESHCTLIVGGWGGMVVGLSNVDDMNASENQTTLGMNFDKNRWYKIRLRVSDERIEVWIDDKRVISQPREGHTFGVWDVQNPLKPFGVATWNTSGALRNFTLRRLGK